MDNQIAYDQGLRPHGNHTASPMPPAPPAAPGRPSAKSNGGVLLVAAAVLLLLLAGAQGYVSFRAQYAFIDHAKRTRVPSMLEALGLDTGAIIFALLALSLARRGRSCRIERALNVACALGSMTMNLLAADLTSPRSVTVWVMPSVLYAFASDRLIAVVRRWVQPSEPPADATHDGSPWRALGRLALWPLRLVFDPIGTLAGLRRWIIAATPVAPGGHVVTATVTSRSPDHQAHGGTVSGGRGLGPGRALAKPLTPPVPSPLALTPGENKREALIRLYEQRGSAGDPRYRDRAKAAQVAGEIAGLIGYHPGTARRELAKYLATLPMNGNGHSPGPQPERADNAQEVT